MKAEKVVKLVKAWSFIVVIICLLVSANACGDESPPANGRWVKVTGRAAHTPRRPPLVLVFIVSAAWYGNDPLDFSLSAWKWCVDTLHTEKDDS